MFSFAQRCGGGKRGGGVAVGMHLQKNIQWYSNHLLEKTSSMAHICYPQGMQIIIKRITHAQVANKKWNLHRALELPLSEGSCPAVGPQGISTKPYGSSSTPSDLTLLPTTLGYPAAQVLGFSGAMTSLRVLPINPLGHCRFQSHIDTRCRIFSPLLENWCAIFIST